MLKNKKKKYVRIVMGVLLLGSIWGVLEATMGNILHFIGLHPYTGQIMTSIGTGLIAFARKLFKVRGIAVFMAVIAALFKALDFLIPGSNVVRPIIAILMIGVVFEGVVAVTHKLKTINIQIQRAISGLAIGYVSITAFAYFTAYVLKFNYWLKMGALGILRYVGVEGWKFGLGAMILYIVGSNLDAGIDKLLKIRLSKIVSTRPFHYFSGAFFVLALIFVVVV